MALIGSGIRLPLLSLEKKYQETMASGLNQLGLTEI
jgi:hypothetical protein